MMKERSYELDLIDLSVWDIRLKPKQIPLKRWGHIKKRSTPSNGFEAKRDH